jgi:hypothetical protein
MSAFDTRSQRLRTNSVSKRNIQAILARGAPQEATFISQSQDSKPPSALLRTVRQENY